MGAIASAKNDCNFPQRRQSRRIPKSRKRPGKHARFTAGSKRKNTQFRPALPLRKNPEGNRFRLTDSFKELVKGKQVLHRVLRNGCASLSCQVFSTGFGARVGRRVLHSSCDLARSPFLPIRFVSVVVAAGSCNRSCQGDCSRHIPSRGTAHDGREQLCLDFVMADADLSLCGIPRRKGHSNHSVVRPGFGHCRPKPPYPRTMSSWPKREGSQIASGNSDRTTGRIWVP